MRACLPCFFFFFFTVWSASSAFSSSSYCTRQVASALAPRFAALARDMQIHPATATPAASVAQVGAAPTVPPPWKDAERVLVGEARDWSQQVSSDWFLLVLLSFIFPCQILSFAIHENVYAY
jgi:hypothetical protein